MERVHLILAALAFGPLTEKGGVSDEVKGAHADLRGLVEGHFGGRVEADKALEGYEAKPETERERLKEVLESTGAVEDFAVVASAQKLLKLADPEGASDGKYAMQARPLGMKIGH